VLTEITSSGSISGASAAGLGDGFGDGLGVCAQAGKQLLESEMRRSIETKVSKKN
jgi:hypothetical protein